MRKLLAFACSVFLVACVVGEDGTQPPVDDPNGSGSGSGSNTAGHITANETWSGVKDIDTATTIDPGVTVTVMPGTQINIDTRASLTVQGILDVQGTSAGKVTIASKTAGTQHGGIKVPMGGELKLAYGVQSGGGIFLSGTGKATIVDTTMSNPGGPSANGDFLVMNGGTLDMSFSEIGLATGDGTHCNMHFGGQGNNIRVTNSTIRGVPYGLMFYGGTNAVFTNNNWENPINVDTSPGVQGDFSGSFFQGGAPTPGAGATLILDNLALAPLADAKPRP